MQQQMRKDSTIRIEANTTTDIMTGRLISELGEGVLDGIVGPA